MARAALNPITVPAAGLALTAAMSAAELTDGNSFMWEPGRRVVVTNNDNTTLTVTVETPGTVGVAGLAIADAPFTVAAGVTRIFPKLGREFRRTDGRVYLNYTGADATVLVGVLDLDN